VFFETSAKTDHNVREIFDSLGKDSLDEIFIASFLFTSSANTANKLPAEDRMSTGTDGTIYKVTVPERKGGCC